MTDATSWYLLGDPEIYPVLGRSHLQGAPLNAVSVDSFETAVVRDSQTGKTRDFPGLAIPARHTVAFNVLSRIGAVKLNKT